MMNLLGASKENFFQLINIMNYKKEDKKEDIFSYKGDKRKKNKIKFITRIDSPFKKLTSLNLK